MIPFFIVGNDRSGTTVLRLALDRSPDVAIPTESTFLADVLPRLGGRVDLGDDHEAKRFMARVWNHPRVRLWGLQGPPPPVPAGLSHKEALRFCLEAPFHAYARREGKERWGDKTPSYLFHTEALLAVWPDARFVEIVRDGRDVALSVMKLPFGANNVWAAARAWASGIREGRRVRERHPQSVYTVVYERMVADPARVVRDVCDWLSLRFEPDMLAIEETPQDKLVADQVGWFAKVWEGIGTSSVGRWRTQMSDRERGVFEAVAGRELRSMGYETESKTAPIPPTRELVYRVHDGAVRLVNFVRLRIVRERGRELVPVLRRKLGLAR